MRQSKREEILQAASAVVQRDGVTALTYESVAAEAQVTKGGLLYHFPSREQMLHALHQYVAGRWEAAMIEQSPAAAEKDQAPQLDDDARFAAFVRASQFPDRAELLLMLEASEEPANNAVWEAVYQRWAPEAPATGETEDHELDRFIARLAADGLWLFQSLSGQSLEPEVRDRVVARIIALGNGSSE